jgi:hypothetical protein
LNRIYLQFNGNETVEVAMKEQEIQREILIPDLQRILRTHKAEVTTELDQKILQLIKEAAVQSQLRHGRRVIGGCTWL